MEKTKGKILIVDDSIINAELLAAALEPIGYNVLIYVSPKKALEDLKDIQIDVVLIDVVMPELNGFKFAEKFLKNHKNTPIIFVSAYTKNENKIKGYNLGSFAYIEKPFDVNTTRAQVQSVLKMKKMQDELFREKEKLDCIFEFSSNEIILTDVNFNIVSQNNKILDKNKYKTKNFFEILDINNQIDARETLLYFIDSKEKQTSFRVIVDDKKYTKTNISRIEGDSYTAGYLIVMDDRTEEIKIEEQRDNFIETLTHDLKTPVRAEAVALELLYKGNFGPLSEEQKDIIKEMLNSSGYMMRMTDNLLTKYKIENNKFKISKQPNSIKQVLEDCLDNMKHLFETKNQIIKIQTNLDNDIFCFDKTRIRRALKNIIANASEYSPSNSTIIISLQKIASHIEISIKDEGQGISKDKLKAIFQEKTEDASRFKKVGTGLGLFVTKKIVEAHGGEIKIATDAKKGTKLTMLLPTEATDIVDVKGI